MEMKAPMFYLWPSFFFVDFKNDKVEDDSDPWPGHSSTAFPQKNTARRSPKYQQFGPQR